jgi:hypothetical protein
MLARLRLFVLVVVALVCGTSPIHAQQAAVRDPVPAAGPRMDASATAMKRMAPVTVDSASAQQRRNQGAGQPVALMAVGGAAIIIGALIGDDVGTVFMIGGAVALLVGLYKYLQ